jgi:oxalate decarboxylase/phosphoglucose isomerase-like protein (cupin superfamily)
MKTLSKMDWSALKHEYDLDGKRLLPWEGLEMPFGGAWCVIRAGTHSLPHSHEENEIFICVQGNADIMLGEERVPVTQGDVVAIPPSTRHYVDNRTAEDFHMYSIWWDREAAGAYMDRTGTPNPAAEGDDGQTGTGR